MFTTTDIRGYGKILNRISKYLELSHAEHLQFKNTVRRCTDLEQYLAYMMKYGIERVIPNGYMWLEMHRFRTMFIIYDEIWNTLQKKAFFQNHSKVQVFQSAECFTFSIPQCLIFPSDIFFFELL